MTYETGVFHEVYKYSKNFKLPIKFVIEDNGLSTNTPTFKAWGKKQKIKRFNLLQIQKKIPSSWHWNLVIILMKLKYKK